MITIISNPAQIITVDTKGRNIKQGKSLSEINILFDHHLIIENGIIKDLIPAKSLTGLHYDEVINAGGKTVIPGLVECHTHTVFAGSRADEFNEKLKGTTYEEIARRGGGITRTVEAVRNYSFEKLVQIAGERVNNFIRQGVTTLEIKSGYGLDFENEIKILKAINYLNSIYPIHIIPTFLGAHVFPIEYKKDKKAYIGLIINKMLPYIRENNLAEFCDGFCETSAFSVEEMDKIFSAAKNLGFKLKLHTDQFNSIGGIDLAAKYKALSVEHLEVISEADIKKISKPDIVSVLLPGVPFFLKQKYAPARALINSGAVVALATDYNPGSSNISLISLIMSLAALNMGMSAEEIISAYTINPAAALNLNKTTGSIEINKKADLAILNTENLSDLIYKIGENLNCMTIKDGKVVFKTEEF